MKKEIVFVLFLILPLVSAANIEYAIINKDVLVEVELSLDEFDFFEFPEKFEISEEKIKYIDKEMIENKGKDYFFIASSPLFLNSSIKVILPEGSFLNEDFFVFPKNYSLKTNGQNIVLEWKNPGEKDILIPYKEKENNLVFAFLLIGLVIFIYFLFYFKKTKSNKYTQNLFKEEKQIMNYLLKRKECWTKELVRELNISKVRLSRKLRKLEERGLIERIPYGNENKIKIKKNSPLKKN